MGMYDVVLPEANLVIGKCPSCKRKFEIDQEWQTKSYESLLYLISLRTLRYSTNENFEIHTICDHCGMYMKAYFNDTNPRIVYSEEDDHFKEINKPLTKKQLELYDWVSLEKESIVNYDRD